jgi:predicted esterase
MDSISFEELQAHFQELYQQGEYGEALQFLEGSGESYPEYAHLLAYWKMALSTRLGENDQALDHLEALLKTGFWYGETLLRKTPAFQPLQGQERFEKLVELSRRLRLSDPDQKYPLLVLHSEGQCLSGGPLCPLALALHANAGLATDSLAFWQPIAKSGWLVGVPQSSQAMWKGAYIWDDRQETKQEIQKHYLAMREQYAVDTNRILLAGHSMGGEMAIELALTNVIPARGFIAIGPGGPWMDDLSNWQPVINNYSGGDLRGYILAGQEDTSIPHDNIEALAEMFNLAGIPVDLEEIPHAGHDFSPEYEAAILRALAFVDPER